MTRATGIRGIGIDLVSIPRFVRSARQAGFLEHVLGPEELVALPSEPEARVIAAALRFAVKEAVLKAVGTGAWQEGTDFPDVRVDVRGSGQIDVTLSAATARLVAAVGPCQVRATATRHGDRFLATAILSTAVCQA